MPAVPVFTPVKGAEAGSGTVREKFFDLTFIQGGADTLYVVGGLAVFPKDVGLVQIHSIAPIGHATATGVAQTDLLILSWDYKIQKLQLFGDAVGAAGASESAAVSLAAITFRVRVVGT